MKKIFILAILTLGLNAKGTYICIAINVGTIESQKAISQEYRDSMDESESGKLFILDDNKIVNGLSAEKYIFDSQKNNSSYYASTKNNEVEILTVMLRDKKLFIQSAKPSRTPTIITYQCSKPKNNGKK
jgi:hypothetical protein